jgi:hypothetical protein
VPLIGKSYEKMALISFIGKSLEKSNHAFFETLSAIIEHWLQI